MARTRMTEENRKAQVLAAAATVAVRERLEGLTLRAVAREAGVSHALVIHHFGSMECLQSALLDWLLAIALVPQTEGLDALPAHARVRAFIESQFAALDTQRDVIGLFFDFWVKGTREESIRERIRTRMATFRQAVVPIAAAWIAAEPHRFRDTNADAVAVAIGDLVLGYEIQRIVNPAAVDRQAILASINSLLALDPHDAAPVAICQGGSVACVTSEPTGR